MSMDQQKYVRLPQPDEIPVREREDAMGAYLMMFAALGAGLPLPIINLIAAIIYYYINKSKSRFVQFHAFQSLLSQIPLTLLNAAAVFWAIRIYFFDWVFNDYFKGYVVMLVIANIIYVIFSLVGALRARKGRFYYFLFFGRLAYQHSYKATDPEESVEPANVPPKM